MIHYCRYSFSPNDMIVVTSVGHTDCTLAVLLQSTYENYQAGLLQMNPKSRSNREITYFHIVVINSSHYGLQITSSLEPASYNTQNSSSELLIPLSVTFI